MSVAFLLKFRNFKYYVGGDLEIPQEDVLMGYLNVSGRSDDRVDAMKTSHHGSKSSSSTAFIKRLDPIVAFISCGTDNQHSHPDQRVVDDLQANNVDYFLTGEKLGGPTTLTSGAEICGVWPPGKLRKKSGTAVLKITQAQAELDKPKFGISYYQPDAGTNLAESKTFRYEPYGRYTNSY